MDTPLAPSQRDPIDGYSPSDFHRDSVPGRDAELAASLEMARDEAIAAVERGELRMDGFDGYVAELMDAYANPLTGLGDPSKDKTFGGSPHGPHFFVRYITGIEASDRWRGSDVGGRIVTTIPNEMTRKGWTISIQPQKGEFAQTPPARRDSWSGLRRAFAVFTGRRDEFPGEQPQKPTHKPGALANASEDGTALVEKLKAEQTKLGLRNACREALCYQRAYGGGGVLIGVDDGGRPLHEPLDPSLVKSIRHLTPYRGGWDGELVAWSWYNDPSHPKFGEPRIYQLRNLGVPIASTPAPGQSYKDVPPMPAGPTGGLIYYVHESRLLLFPGQPVDRRSRVQMRGWSDSIFTRVDRTMAQFDQAWSGVSILMTEYSLPVMSMEGLAQLLATNDKKGQGIIAARAKALQMAMSIANVRLIDTKEKIERLSVPMGGVEGVLAQFWARLAAAAEMPQSMLMGQVQGGLGDASKGDVLFFYDQVAGRQQDELLPAVEKFTHLQLLAKHGPTNGVLPQKWGVAMNPLREMTDAERATYRKTIAETDSRYIQDGVVTPEEVAATRFGGSEFNDGPIVLDLEGRSAVQQPEPEDEPADTPPPEVPEPTLDAADFVTRGGRTKVRTCVSKVAAFNDDGLMLFGRRKDNGKWSQPGGHAMTGETALGCAIRELFEEAGLHPLSIEALGTKTQSNGSRTVRVSVFLARVSGEPTAENDPDGEFDAFRWVDVDAVPPEVSDNLHHGRDAVRQLLRKRR